MIDTRLANLPRFDEDGMRIVYREWHAGYTRQLARRLPIGAEIVLDEAADAGNSPMRVLIGQVTRSRAARKVLVAAWPPSSLQHSIRDSTRVNGEIAKSNGLPA